MIALQTIMDVLFTFFLVMFLILDSQIFWIIVISMVLLFQGVVNILDRTGHL